MESWEDVGNLYWARLKIKVIKFFHSSRITEPLAHQKLLFIQNEMTKLTNKEEKEKILTQIQDFYASFWSIEDIHSEMIKDSNGEGSILELSVLIQQLFSVKK